MARDITLFFIIKDEREQCTEMLLTNVKLPHELQYAIKPTLSLKTIVHNKTNCSNYNKHTLSKLVLISII